MRERVALLGGTLRAGPRPDGGWLVEAVLPMDGPPADGPPAARSAAAGPLVDSPPVEGQPVEGS